MNIYIVRHGIAVEQGTSGLSDADRPLTKEGIERMQKAARGLKRFLDPPDLIVSSPLLRAKQTAEILAVALQTRDGVEEWAELSPASAPHSTVTLLKSHADTVKSVVLVSHEPHVSALAALLLGMKPLAVSFKKGAICALSCPHSLAAGKAELLWFLTPKQLRLLA